MAPLASSNDVTDLGTTFTKLDTRSTRLDELFSNAIPSTLQRRETSFSRTSPTEMYHLLTSRDDGVIRQPDHGGAVDPNNINMKGIQALFALIGVVFVLGIVWFFFWAKNGGFQWQKGDWDDYKSTVLRRKGPNGTTLSNATKSTRLGGGSVVGEGYSDGCASTVDGTMSETMTELSSEAGILKRNKKETAKERKIREVQEAEWEGGNDHDVLAYIREKPARVGGINKDSEALHYGTDYTDTEGSQVHNSRQTRAHAPRGPSASSSRQPSPEKRQTRRDFSYGNEESFSVISGSQPEMSQHPYPEIPAPVQFQEVPPPTPPHRPGRYHSPSKQFQQDTSRRSGQYSSPSDYNGSAVSEIQNQNTKAYHHPLPSLTPQNPTRGYRRDRRDSLE